VVGEASPATSGTPRPPALPEGLGTLAFCCQVGSAKTLLTPPPLAPPCAPSFQTTSLVMVVPLPTSFVPPHPSTCGLDAGKSTLLPPLVTPSLDPLSPEATVMVIPNAPADAQALSMDVMDACVHPDSGPPQLIEMTVGAFPMS